MVQAQLASVETGDLSYAEINAAFRTILSVIDENLTAIAALGAAGHDALVAVTRCRSLAVALRDAYVGNFDRATVYVVPRSMAMWQVAREVYGNALQVNLLYRANQAVRSLRVPMGTRLYVLPIETAP